MSDKNFKIRPTTWPKEYTFEEFKQLNPNINENILINYYNKYLYEYAEDRSRHRKHFNNTKQQLGEEIRLLKNNNKQLKLQLDEVKVYLLENIEKKAKASLDFLTSEFKKEANENRKNINSKQERLVTEEFKKLKIDINNDLENLANNVMNSRIL